MGFRLVCILLLGIWVVTGETEAQTGDKQSGAKTINLPVMTWHHPVLEPACAGMTLVCTVVSVTEHPPVYNNPYCGVRLRIDERIQVTEQYEKRLQGVQFILAGDFRQRRVGERVVLFGGGEQYEGDDFLMPCWSGTETDLGILLHPKEHSNFDANERLLQQLRAYAKGKYEESEFMQAFAEFCPQGVAETFIWRLRMKEARHDKVEGSTTEK